MTPISGDSLDDQSREIDWQKAREEIDESACEQQAFLDFSDCLNERQGFGGKPKKFEGEPADYLLQAADKSIGVQVTTLRACEDAIRANKRVEAVLEVLEEEAKDLKLPGSQGIELLFEPDSPQSTPDATEVREVWPKLRRRINSFEAPDLSYEKVNFRGFSFFLRPCSELGPGVHVAHQGFFVSGHEQEWEQEINENIMRKVRHYSVKPDFPFWLLLNLKPYLYAAQDIEKFLCQGVPVRKKERVKEVFDRVYAVTDELSSADSSEGPVAPIKRLL